MLLSSQAVLAPCPFRVWPSYSTECASGVSNMLPAHVFFPVKLGLSMQANRNAGCSAPNSAILYDAGNKTKCHEPGCQEHTERLYCRLLQEPSEWLFKRDFEE